MQQILCTWFSTFFQTKNILSIFFALLVFIGVSAQEYQYKETLTEGKTWKILVYSYTSTLGYLTYKVSGDTIVDGRTCKRIQVVEQNTPNLGTVSFTNIAAYEENGKIYSYEGDKSSVLIDFDRELGDGFFSKDDDTKVTKVDYVTVNGITRKRILFERPGSEPICYVEGIGASRDVFMNETERCSVERYLLECYDNDQLVFSMDDFGVSQPWFLSVGSVTKDERTATGEKYSINGIRLNEEPVKGIYIMDGKKIAK